MSVPARPPSSTQLSKNLPAITTFVTGHNGAGKAVVQADRPSEWSSQDNDNMGFSTVYTSNSTPDLNGDTDVKLSKELVQSGELSLVNPKGGVCRFVDFAPGYKCIMHRTLSLDYGIVIEGVVELLLDSGDTRILQRGDVAVQRATQHAWRNASETEWARMMFMLTAIQEPLKINGEAVEQDLKAEIH